MLRILIADDHDVVRSGLRKVLQAQPGWEVVAEAADGKEAISKAVATTPDVAVLDCMMPLINGVEATRQIQARVANTEVLIFTMCEDEPCARFGGRLGPDYADERLIEESLMAGARGYLLKSDVAGRLSYPPCGRWQSTSRFSRRRFRKRCLLRC
jgi:CheY-like chemotaxis protein